MTLIVAPVYVTPAEYLAAELVSESKHEYADGRVYAMAGASRAHNRIARNILTALSTRLQARSCEPFGSDMRLRIDQEHSTFYYYPDVTVECEESTGNEVEHPVVIMEVLSPSTDRVDSAEKWANYRQIPSLKAYLMVEQGSALVIVHRRDETGEWHVELHQNLSGTVDLPEIGCSLPLSTIYERVLSSE